MSSGRFPKPYLNDVPEAGTAPGVETVPFKSMGIGARPSGMPRTVSEGPKPIQHVGGTTNGR